MDIDRFWQLIDQARTAAGPEADQAVRDFDLRDDADPDRDYWDFDEAELRELMAERSGRGDADRVSDGMSDSSADDGDTGDGGVIAGEFAGEYGYDDEDDDYEGDEDEDDVTDPVASALYELLTQLPAAEIAGFDNTFEDIRAKADHETLVNAATLIEHGFLNDESFDDFRAGLVALGRRTFESAVTSPDSLAEHPLVREIAAAGDPRWLGREDMLFVASHAYAAVTGEPEITFYEYAESLRDSDPTDAPEIASSIASGDSSIASSGDSEPGGPGWLITDEAETRRRLPRLSEMFYARSMRNRQRAPEKLGLQA